MSYQINNDQKELFHDYTDIFIKNLNKVKQSTHKNLIHLINDQDICIMSANKDSCVVKLKETDYINKLETMINIDTDLGTYVECQDTKPSDLKQIKDFLRRSFKNYINYDKTRPVADQTAKTLCYS